MQKNAKIKILIGGKNHGEIKVYPIDEELLYWAFLYDDCFKGDVVEINCRMGSSEDEKLEAVIEDYYKDEINIILNEYSLIYRYSKICHDYREQLISEFGWSNNEFNEIYEQFDDLLWKIEKEYSYKDHEFDPKKRYDRLLTDETRLLLNAVDKLDKERWENKTKDHFPYYMSDYAVLQAIKEAYTTADIIGVYKNNLILCEGNTKSGLKVRIYFDMKEKRIITAYPVSI